MKARTLTIAICLLVALVDALLVTSNVHVTIPEGAQPFDGVKLYKESFELIRDNHLALVDPIKRQNFIQEWENPALDRLKDEKSADLLIAQMLNSQHYPHDQYMRPDDVAEEAADTTPTVGTIGARLAIEGKVESITAEHPLIIAEDPVAGTPAALAGLHKNDALIAVKTEAESEETITDASSQKGAPVGEPAPKAESIKHWQTLVGYTLEEATSQIEGKPDSVVELKVQHFDNKLGKLNDSVEEIALTLDAQIRKVVTYNPVEDCISFVDLADFLSKYARQEFKDALDKTVEHAGKCNGKGGLIFSLRQNRGGNLYTAYAVLSMLIDTGVAVVIRERNQDQLESITYSLTPDLVTVITSRGDNAPIKSETKRRPAYVDDVNESEGTDYDSLSVEQIFSKAILPSSFKVVVLLDDGSASAAELVSGSLKANHRATLLGTGSYGKDHGQKLFALNHGGISTDGEPIRNLRITSFQFMPGGVTMGGSGIIPDIIMESAPAGQGDNKITDPQINAAIKVIHDQWDFDDAQSVLKAESARAKQKRDDRLLREKNESIDNPEEQQ